MLHVTFLSLAPSSPASMERRKAYMMSGMQVCAAGVGEGANFGTLPRQMSAETLLGMKHWVKVIRSPEAGERITEGIHYERLNGFEPRTIIFHDATLAHRSDWLGDRGGTYITLTPSVVSEADAVVDKPCADVTQIPTPPTPPGT